MRPTVPFDRSAQEQFRSQGFVRLGVLLSTGELAALQTRLDDIMRGRVRYENMRFQLDPGIVAEGEQATSNHHVASTLAYRRIDDLEQDPLFLRYMQHELFREITRKLVGEQVSVFRSMFMNKAAQLGTPLRWHQDVGVGWRIDCNPTVTVWTALDDSTPANGCVRIVPGSHQHGVINAGHWLDDEQIARYAPTARVIDLVAEAGEAILLHNFLVHSSGVNGTNAPRRAFSTTYMDAVTRSVVTGETFPIVFGSGALNPAAAGSKPAARIRVSHG